MQPYRDYVHCKAIKPDTAVITTTSVEDHWQTYEVLAVGKGKYEFGVFIEPSVQVGDIIYVQKHAEGDTPPELAAKEEALIRDSEIMAIKESLDGTW